MQQGRLLAILFFLTMMFVTGCQSETLTISGGSIAQVEIPRNEIEQSGQETMPVSLSNDLSCVSPTHRNKELCDAYEEQVLASVVRLEVKGPSRDDPDQLTGGVAHGTIKDGRYLVVHNHFGVDLSVFAEDYYPGYASVRIYRPNNRLILMGGSPPLFEIILEDPETLVLDFGSNDEGVGFFDQFEMSSAKFISWDEINLQPGVEVAQVDWDGENTHIEWVTVDEVVIGERTSQLILKNQIEIGSSGGGIFLNGVHIANNWMSVEFASEGQPLNDLFSIAALNSERVAGTGRQ